MIIKQILLILLALSGWTEYTLNSLRGNAKCTSSEAVRTPKAFHLNLRLGNVKIPRTCHLLAF